MPADDADIGTIPLGAVDREGRFQTPGLPPGRYVLALPLAQLRGLHVRSVRVGQQEFAGLSMDLGSSDVGDVLISLTTHPASLSGKVFDRGGGPRHPATVCLFPANDRWWADYGSTPMRLLAVAVAADGQYRFRRSIVTASRANSAARGLGRASTGDGGPMNTRPLGRCTSGGDRRHTSGQTHRAQDMPHSVIVLKPLIVDPVERQRGQHAFPRSGCHRGRVCSDGPLRGQGGLACDKMPTAWSPRESHGQCAQSGQWTLVRRREANAWLIREWTSFEIRSATSSGEPSSASPASRRVPSLQPGACAG